MSEKIAQFDHGTVMWEQFGANLLMQFSPAACSCRPQPQDGHQETSGAALGRTQDGA